MLEQLPAPVIDLSWAQPILNAMYQKINKDIQDKYYSKLTEYQSKCNLAMLNLFNENQGLKQEKRTLQTELKEKRGKPSPK